MSHLIVVRSQSRSPAETGLAWCSLKHFRGIDGSVPVKNAPHLSAGLCQTEITKIPVAQVLVVSQPPTWPTETHFQFQTVHNLTDNLNPQPSDIIFWGNSWLLYPLDIPADLSIYVRENQALNAHNHNDWRRYANKPTALSFPG